MANFGVLWYNWVDTGLKANAAVKFVEGHELMFFTDLHTYQIDDIKESDLVDLQDATNTMLPLIHYQYFNNLIDFINDNSRLQVKDVFAIVKELLLLHDDKTELTLSELNLIETFDINDYPEQTYDEIQKTRLKRLLLEAFELIPFDIQPKLIINLCLKYVYDNFELSDKIINLMDKFKAEPESFDLKDLSNFLYTIERFNYNKPEEFEIKDSEISGLFEENADDNQISVGDSVNFLLYTSLNQLLDLFIVNEELPLNAKAKLIISVDHSSIVQLYCLENIGFETAILNNDNDLLFFSDKTSNAGIWKLPYNSEVLEPTIINTGYFKSPIMGFNNIDGWSVYAIDEDLTVIRIDYDLNIYNINIPETTGITKILNTNNILYFTGNANGVFYLDVNNGQIKPVENIFYDDNFVIGIDFCINVIHYDNVTFFFFVNGKILYYDVVNNNLKFCDNVIKPLIDSYNNGIFTDDRTNILYIRDINNKLFQITSSTNLISGFNGSVVFYEYPLKIVQATYFKSNINYNYLFFLTDNGVKLKINTNSISTVFTDNDNLFIDGEVDANGNMYFTSNEGIYYWDKLENTYSKTNMEIGFFRKVIKDYDNNLFFLRNTKINGNVYKLKYKYENIVESID